MVAAFLRGRKMQIKAGDEKSDKRLVKGGSPQGTLLGNYLFVITTDDLEGAGVNMGVVEGVVDEEEDNLSEESFHTADGSDGEADTSNDGIISIDKSFGRLEDSFHSAVSEMGSSEDEEARESRDERLHAQNKPKEWQDRDLRVYKYVDDFLGIEKVCINNGQMTFSQNKTEVCIRAGKSENFYKTVEARSRTIGMSVNQNKTQMLCVSPSLHYNTKTYIQLGNNYIKGQETLKILGFVFGRKPDISSQIASLSLKFRKRVWVLRHLKKAGIPSEDLVKLYLSLVLPVLDYTSVVYHSMLNKIQEDEIEKLQKLALKIIYGIYGVTYMSLLERSGLVPLKQRRMKFIDNFLKKTIETRKYIDWFPTKEFSNYNLRTERLYVEKKARTSRLYNSPLFYFRRRLNTISI